jgi:hypothetical protein
MSQPTCYHCSKSKSQMWWCRACRAHFCGDCAGGAFTTFACPKGHRDVMKV